MPAPDDVGPDDAARGCRRRPERDVVRTAAREALGHAADRLPSQAAFRRALLPILREIDPGFVLGSRRMRAMLQGAPGIRMRVRYRETEDRTPLHACPVCANPVEPIRNRTLLGDEVVLGYRCTRCAYWTHRKRRVPVRYSFVRIGRGRSRA